MSKVKAKVQPGEAVLVILDSCHTQNHVLRELEAYHSLVAVGSYLVATDGIIRDLSDVPRGKLQWAHDNPAEAAAQFLKTHPEFRLEQPAWPFNESELSQNITHWPDAYLQRIR